MRNFRKQNLRDFFLLCFALFFLLQMNACGLPIDSSGVGDAPTLDTSDFGMSYDDKSELGDNRPRYLLRRSEWSVDGGNANGTTVVDDECVADPDSTSDRDIFCVIHADELDLQYHEMTLLRNAPASKCEFTRFRSPWYWEAPAGSPSASMSYYMDANGDLLTGYGTTLINGVTAGTFTGTATTAVPGAGSRVITASTLDEPSGVTHAINVILADGAQVMVTAKTAVSTSPQTFSTGRYYTVRDWDAATHTFNLAESATGTRYQFSGAGTISITVPGEGASGLFSYGMTVNGSGQAKCAFDYSDVDGAPNCCEGTHLVTKRTLGESISAGYQAADHLVAEDVEDGQVYMVMNMDATITGDLVVGSLFVATVTDADNHYFTLTGPVGAGSALATIGGSGIVTIASVGDPEGPDEEDWGGKIVDCLKGPAMEVGPKSGDGYPWSLYEHIPSGNVQSSYDVKKGYSGILPLNYKLANFIAGVDPDDSTTWTPMYQSPSAVKNSAGITMSGWGATSISGNPFFIYECLDRDSETKARIRLAIQDWNDSSEFETFIDSGTGDPDSGADYTDAANFETNFPGSPINDFVDADDIDDYYNLPYAQSVSDILFTPAAYGQWPGVFSTDGGANSLALESESLIPLQRGRTWDLLRSNPNDFLSRVSLKNFKHSPQGMSFNELRIRTGR